MIEADGHAVRARTILKDDAELIADQLDSWITDPAIDCIVTTGGTGVTGRDVTPEAFDRVLEKKIDGFGEMFRWLSFQLLRMTGLQLPVPHSHQKVKH